MERMIEEINPEDLPFDIEDELGEVALARQPYPGAYFVTTRGIFDPKCDEYYIVLDNSPAISQTVKKYGEALPNHPGLLLYPFSSPRSGWRLVDYEGLKYLTQNHLPIPEDESLRRSAIYSAEYHPEYFGPFPVPVLTPSGCTLRYKALDNGIYWLETEHCVQMLAVCYPIWSSELAEYALKFGQQMEYDRTHGIDNTFGYLFFSEHDSSVPIFNLLQSRRKWSESGCIQEAALMNAIWKDFPEYAASHNLREETGANDFLGHLLNFLGEDVELKGSSEHNITISPGAGTKFFIW